MTLTANLYETHTVFENNESEGQYILRGATLLASPTRRTNVVYIRSDIKKFRTTNSIPDFYLFLNKSPHEVLVVHA